jgi:hypothetical protein
MKFSPGLPGGAFVPGWLEPNQNPAALH